MRPLALLVFTFVLVLFPFLVFVPLSVLVTAATARAAQFGSLRLLVVVGLNRVQQFTADKNS